MTMRFLIRSYAVSDIICLCTNRSNGISSWPWSWGSFCGLALSAASVTMYRHVILDRHLWKDHNLLIWKVKARRGCGASGAGGWENGLEEAMLSSSDYLDRVLGGLSLLARCASKSICLRALS